MWVIARHPRSYEREDFGSDPLHYLALIEQKISALDQAAPLAGWPLPEEFATLRRLLEARMGKQGKREFVQVLRLMEVFKLEEVRVGAKDCSSAPLTEPDMRATRPALWIVVSERQKMSCFRTPQRGSTQATGS